MSDDSKRLFAMKEQIDAVKIKKAQVEGALNQNLARLKDDFEVSTLKRGKEKLEKLKDKESELQKKFDKQIEKLEEAYEWD